LLAEEGKKQKKVFSHDAGGPINRVVQVKRAHFVVASASAIA
jgi:hypothetical protein